MKYLYLLERTDSIDYDNYDSIIVCASTADEAIKIRPEYGWASEEYILLTKIGVAEDSVETGIVLESFNAG